MTAPTAEAQPTLVLSPEHEDFRDSLRGFLERHAPESAVRAAMATGAHDGALWSRLSEELGLPGLTIPERLDGAGYGPLDAVPAFEELGRALAPVPYFETVALGASALLESGDEETAPAHLRWIASGEATATLAWTGPDGRSVAVEATPSHGGHVLHGQASFVPGGAKANLLIVAARLDGRIALFATFGDSAALTRAPMRSLDELRPLAALAFDGTPAALLGDPAGGELALSRTLDRARAALAAEQVGGAGKLLELAVAYAKDRVQFGRPIGSYQAIKHRCADMLCALESARALAYYANWAAAEAPDELPAAASAAKVACSDAYAYIAQETIEVHGGIGFTWEHPAHLYFKRAHSSRVLLGTPAEQRARFADVAG
ncbi:acyl-CoA/acyl-ACP dehydrogenase [Solirubrobacter ginsenosidimutans]|uniref:Acyl-CoA/acyl-ACP dehydrogenase n=1 Tax=Solirubrobacter ginsenosidimutans TaxID=490573 RepID=A0A9X3MQ45_9ACTN|nr:acyl-CoA dehydrogenase family protein [Solirubrobacter ginsenosidimutans]MDA0160347.1 acyl-CoA/acyl-ACP dehydrogenase [Solirubrobacter ginsenosidimutans]